MSDIKKLLRVLLVILTVCSCASTKLDISVDLYKGQTNYGRLWNQDEVANILSLSSDIHVRTEKIGLEKIRLMNELNRLEKWYDSHLVGDSDFSVQDDYLDQYKNEVNFYIRASYSDQQRIRNSAKHFFSSVNIDSPDLYANEDVFSAQNDIRVTLNSMGVNLSSVKNLPNMQEYENQQIEVIKELILSLLDEVNEGIDDNQRNDIVNSLRQLNEFIKELEIVQQEIISDLSNDLSRIEFSLTGGSDDDTPNDILFANAYNSFSGLSFGLSTIESTSLITKTKSLVESQNYRLEDLADPIWTKISSASDELWKEEFNKTYFFSKGNNSVVMVRDDPSTFRVQQGSNNPAALIQGQLQVARAVADAGIEITSVLSGIHLDFSSDSDSETEAPFINDQRLMEISRENKSKLLNEINEILVQLNDPNADFNTVRDELAVVLFAYKLKYESDE